MDGSDACAGEESNDGFGDHGEVQGHGVALAHAHLLQGVGELGDFAQELAVGDDAAVGGIVGLVDDCGLVWVLEGVAVDAVVAGVQPALDEPGIVAVLEAAGVDGLEVALPGEQLAGEATPELVGVLDRLLVQLLVVLEAVEMGLGVRVLSAARVRILLGCNWWVCLVMGAQCLGSRCWRGHPASAGLCECDETIMLSLVMQHSWCVMGIEGLTRKRPWGRGRCRPRGPRAPRAAWWSRQTWSAPKQCVGSR